MNNCVKGFLMQIYMYRLYVFTFRPCSGTEGRLNRTGPCGPFHTKLVCLVVLGLRSLLPDFLKHVAGIKFIFLHFNLQICVCSVFSQIGVLTDLPTIAFCFN